MEGLAWGGGGRAAVASRHGLHRGGGGVHGGYEDSLAVVGVARKTFDAMPRAARGEACWADDRRFDSELADELAGWKSHDLMAL